MHYFFRKNTFLLRRCLFRAGLTCRLVVRKLGKGNNGSTRETPRTGERKSRGSCHFSTLPIVTLAPLYSYFTSPFLRSRCECLVRKNTKRSISSKNNETILYTKEYLTLDCWQSVFLSKFQQGLWKRDYLA